MNNEKPLIVLLISKSNEIETNVIRCTSPRSQNKFKKKYFPMIICFDRDNNEYVLCVNKEPDHEPRSSPDGESRCRPQQRRPSHSVADAESLRQTTTTAAAAAAKSVLGVELSRKRFQHSLLQPSGNFKHNHFPSLVKLFISGSRLLSFIQSCVIIFDSFRK